MKNLKKYFLEKIYEKISKKELENLENFLEKERKNLEKERKNLEKENEEIIITDLDDTIFSTYERFIFYPKLKKLRGCIGNNYIIENIGFKNYIKKIYKNKTYPKTILSKLNKNNDLILTAGIENFQIMKIKELGLEKFNYITTNKDREKVLELIKYVILKLKYSPEKITIYEDRPHFFVYFKEFLEDFLSTKIEIIYVEMNGNNIEPKLEKIEF